MIFSLFRISAVRRYRDVLAGPTTDPQHIIQNLLNTSPSADSLRGYTWLVGNLQPLSDNYTYFRFGRESPTHRAYFDDAAKVFVDVDDPEAPYTHVILDLKYQVIAIAKHPRLSPSVIAIAKALQHVLNHNIKLIDSRYEIEIKPINDPEDLLTFIKEAYKIMSITFEVGRKNNWDASRDVQEPLEKIIALAKSKLAITTIEGDDVDRKVAEGIARAVSAKGRSVSARGIRRRGEKAHVKTIQKAPIEISTQSPRGTEDIFTISEWVRSLYLKIRTERL